jgi:predicted nicotinamide N-methyase
MKYKVPEEYQARFDMLIRSLPLDLQNDIEFQEALLVHLKLGGMNLARHLAETTLKYHNVDVLEIGTGLRFPKVVDAKPEGDEDENEDEDEADDPEDEDNEDNEDENVDEE